MLKNKVFGCLSLLLLLSLTNKTFAQCTTPSLVTVSPSQLCAPGGTTNLNASSSAGSSIAWYTVAVGGSPLGSAPTGSNFNVNASSTTTFYAESFTISTNSLTLNYTGNVQVFTASVTGNYTFQAWGGKGGFDGLIGANGGYAAGVLALNAGQTVAINVGGLGLNGSGAGSAGWNGGGAAGLSGSSGGGGGASDVRSGGTALINRVLVAGGGGGGGNNLAAGAGGGLTGDGYAGTPLSGGSQIAGGTGGNGNGALGQGGNHTADGGGGGGGYYGGSAGNGDSGGGGGSSYIAGVSNGTTIAGSASMPNPIGGTMIGNATAGLVRIFYPNIGCVSVSRTAVIFTVNPNPIITVNNGAICAGQNFTINPAGASTYSYSSGLAIVNPSTNITYTVTGTSVAGCTNTAVSSVTVNPNPVITVNNGTICAGQNFTIIAAGASSYSYSSGSSVIAPTSNANYTVTGSNVAGCSNTAVSIIIVNASPIITVNSGAICLGQSFTINPNGANTYTIQGGNSVVSPSVNSTYNVIGTNTITGCISQSFATSNLTVNPNPTVSISGPSVVCLGESIALVANGANTYVWNNNATTTTIVITPTTTSTYSVVGTDTNGCVGLSASLGVIVNTVPIISIASTATTICVGEGVILTANGANTYTWSGGLNTSSISVSPSVSTTYSASGSGTNGCVGSNTLQVIVSQCTSINTIASKTEFKVYPNPNNGEFTIELTNINNSNITITNVLGQIIKTQKAELMNQINLNVIEKGIYFINVLENNQSVYRSSMIKE